MTGEELRQARARLGLTGPEFAQAFFVSVRTLRGWENGNRDGKQYEEIPKLVAVLVELALVSAAARRKLGIKAR